ncbi:hypothetical protein [Pseudomonas sp. P8_241]|uniref:hypothetical protein n=1 Tax=Pseudomonas sp. P8_241 TaxID=3043445 RepID=UPI002A35C162|nr:hypothetical protein [Pseudomonas sp. P8_241]WPN49166.1 hypothetical protein QMK58_11075 [Pseudomonas sp. P8_241]
MTLKQQNSPVGTWFNQQNSEHQETAIGISIRREFVSSPNARMTTDILLESDGESAQQRAAIVRLHSLIVHSALLFDELPDEVAAIAFRDAFELLVTTPIFDDDTHQYWHTLDAAREVARRISNSRITVAVRRVGGNHEHD